MTEAAIDKKLLEKGLGLLESHLGPAQTLQFMAMVSRQPFDYQTWRDNRFDKMNVEEILEQAKLTENCNRKETP